MTWKPNPRIAAVLGLLTSPLGMLYVQRPRLAALYLGLSFLVATASFCSLWLFGSEIVAMLISVFGWVIAINCAAHAYSIARNAPIAVERNWYSRWYSLAGIFVVTFLAVFFTRSFLYEPFRTPSQSMYPSIPAGSIVIVEKRGFGYYGTFGIRLWQGKVTEKIRRGDVIVHLLVADPSTNYLTRIVALPGEHIVYSKREMTINGRPVPVSPGRHDDTHQLATERLDDLDIEVAFMPERLPRDFDEVVPPHHYAVFGDNRDNARDSRYIGFVPQENIVGRVATVLRPRE